MLSKKGFTLPEIMIVIGIIAILAAIALPNLLRSRTTSNQAVAQAALKSIAVSMENFATVNGTYPSLTTDLTGATPPYLNNDYFTGTHNGYNFAPTLGAYSYSVTATPASVNQGTESYTITTGGVLVTN